MLAAAVCVVALSPGCPTGGGVAGAGSRPTTVTPTGAAPVGAPPNRESPWCVRPIVNGPSRTAVPIVTVNQFPGYHCTARRTLQVKPSRGSSGRSRAVGAADPIAVQGFGARNRLGATTTYGLPIVDRSIRGAVDATGGLAIDADRRLSARSHEIGFMPTSHRPRRHHSAAGTRLTTRRGDLDCRRQASPVVDRHRAFRLVAVRGFERAKSRGVLSNSGTDASSLAKRGQRCAEFNRSPARTERPRMRRLAGAAGQRPSASSHCRCGRQPGAPASRPRRPDRTTGSDR